MMDPQLLCHAPYLPFIFICKGSCMLWKQNLTGASSVRALGYQGLSDSDSGHTHICHSKIPPEYLTAWLMGPHTMSASCLCLFIN